MFRFIALLLVVLVDQSSAEAEDDFPGCVMYYTINAMENFNSTRFFSGIWYITHVYPLNDKNQTTIPICVSIKPLIISKPIGYPSMELKIRQHFDAFTPSYVVHHLFWEGRSTLRNRSVGKFEVDLVRVNNKGYQFDPYSIIFVEKIIATDYDDYAVINVCSNKDFFFIISRSEIIEDNPKYEEILSSLGLKLSDFANTKDLHCSEYD